MLHYKSILAIDILGFVKDYMKIEYNIGKVDSLCASSCHLIVPRQPQL